MFSALLFALSALLVFGLGIVHAVFTLSGTQLRPKTAQTMELMQKDHMRITAAATIWQAWIGFNLSHSLGLILYALVFGYLGFFEQEFFSDSLFLQSLGLAILITWTVLAKTYWFSKPFLGILTALIFYILGLVILHASS